MKKALFIIIILAAIIVLVIFGGLMIIRNQSQQALSSITYETVDMSQAADGEYIGQADAGLVQVKVAVTIKDHTIDKIDILEHKSGMGQKAENITTSMVNANNFDVDAISGATLSSEVIKSAVSKALKESCKK